jgi:probable selenium-dependent hydroxylase accessory protein YqeC
VALVGGGGKTSAAGLLAREMAAAGGRVVVTTTTAMFHQELAAMGALVMEADEAALAARLREALAGSRIVAVAHSPRERGKVAGLAPEVIDRLWTEGEVDCMIVEADGSRGMSLKAFAPHEPRVPAGATVIVQMAGLDVVGAPLTAQSVHRADELAAALRLPLGAVITPSVVADCLRGQLQRLHGVWQAARLVTLLNKADRPLNLSTGEQVAYRLLEDRASLPDAAEPSHHVRPDRVVLASIRNGHFARVAATGT